METNIKRVHKEGACACMHGNKYCDLIMPMGGGVHFLFIDYKIFISTILSCNEIY